MVTVWVQGEGGVVGGGWSGGGVCVVLVGGGKLLALFALSHGGVKRCRRAGLRC